MGCQDDQLKSGHDTRPLCQCVVVSNVTAHFYYSSHIFISAFNGLWIWTQRFAGSTFLILVLAFTRLSRNNIVFFRFQVRSWKKSSTANHPRNTLENIAYAFLLNAFSPAIATRSSTPGLKACPHHGHIAASLKQRWWQQGLRVRLIFHFLSRRRKPKRVFLTAYVCSRNTESPT